jgi:hypothetical protein
MKIERKIPLSPWIWATRLSLAMIVPLAVLAGQACTPSATTQRTFSSPEEAVQALVDALRADDEPTLLAIFGKEIEDLIHTGDRVQDQSSRAEFVARYDRRHEFDTSTSGRAVLIIGDNGWPFPIPVIEAPEGWLFDTEQGREEIINRKIGRNELSTIQTCLAVADAQQEYFRQDHDADGILEYSAKFISTPDTKDGLSWETSPGQPQSPLGDLIAAANVEGYTDLANDEPRPYHGYYFKVLTSQGTSAPGGAYDYMARGNMIGGFAVISCPAKYGVSGVMTFMLNQDGVLYQKDLGKDTIAIAKETFSFNPDPSWKPVPKEDLSPELAEP